MIFGIPNNRAMFTSPADNIFNKERLQDRISSTLKYILKSKQEGIQSESVTFTKEEKARLTAPFFGDSNEINDAELVYCPDGISYKQESLPFFVDSNEINEAELTCFSEKLSYNDEEESVASSSDSNETNETELTCFSEKLSYNDEEESVTSSSDSNEINEVELGCSSDELCYINKEESVSDTSRSLISKIMTVWNKYTQLSYLSEKLDMLAEDHKVRLYTYTAGLIFKESDSGVRKIVQILSSLSGITHICLITTLFLDKVLPSSKKI
ncbi:MAG: hypothetical protein ACRCSV_01675 [Chlamydiales bacterium]